MSEPRLLPAPIKEPDDEKVLDEAVRHLENRIADKKRELKQLEAMVATTAAKLRTLHLALSAFFGESVQESRQAEPDATQPIPASRYEAWKERLPEACGKVIDALLVQPLTRTQLKGFCKLAYSTVAGAVKVLENNGLIEEVGEKIRLRSL